MSPNKSPTSLNLSPESALALDCARIVAKAYTSMGFAISAVDVRVYGADGRDLAFATHKPVTP